MYLKQIIIQGFKSFADKTKIELDKGITCIVGPNGSGKSNVVDAVRWVLGEQSVKQLRGSESMLDVIFSGSKSRKASNFASVSLVFDNSSKYLNIDFSEVVIKRMVYSNRETEYYINNERCRLKDILNLMIDSGAYRDSYNIISQGDVNNIFSYRPEDRRIIFESAAGVLKYKKRKEEAQRKIIHTRDNIVRINDILNEIEIRIDPLKDQEEKAKAYINTKDELKNIEIGLLVKEIKNTNNELLLNNEILNSSKNEILEMENKLSLDYANLEKNKFEIVKLNEILNKFQKELIEKTTNVEKLNSEKNILIERKKYKADDIKTHTILLNLKEQKLMTNSELNKIEKDILIIKDKIIEEEKSIETLNREIEYIKTTKNNLNMNELLKEKISLEYSIASLEKNIEDNSDLPYSVRAILSNTKLKGIHNSLGKLIKYDDKYTTAVHTALGMSSQFIICDNESNAKSAISYLKLNDIGRATFFPLNIIKKRTIDTDTLNSIKNIEGFISMATDILKYDSIYEDVIYNQLGNIIIVDNIDTANKIGRLINYKYRIVTIDGEIIHVGGSLTGGNQKNKSYKVELINKKDKLDKLNLKLVNIEKDNIKMEQQLYILEDKKKNQIQGLVNNKYTLESKLNISNDFNQKLNIILSEINSIENINILEEEEKLMKEYYLEVESKNKIISSIENNKDKLENLNIIINEIEKRIKEYNTLIITNQNSIKDLEIDIAKKNIKIENALNILNEEYNMTFERAEKEHILLLDENIARKNVNSLRRILKNLGMVNISAIEEYKEVSERYEFLSQQKADLYTAENTLTNIIEEMDKIMEVEFLETFKKIQIEFKEIFKVLFNGGTAELKLTDPNNILETGIEINALPPGKKLQHISLLSGGEKALTSIALLFSILKVKPTPFCLLDEIETSLDEVNVGVFGNFLNKFKEQTQIIMITHKKQTMEYADSLYGITMQESGVSKLVSVKLK